MTHLELALLNKVLLAVSRDYLEKAKPLGDSDNYICNMTTSMVLAGIAEALIKFQTEDLEDL
jgi:hypothetical protein